jgi:hypothetical protein
MTFYTEDSNKVTSGEQTGLWSPRSLLCTYHSECAHIQDSVELQTARDRVEGSLCDNTKIWCTAWDVGCYCPPNVPKRQRRRCKSSWNDVLFLVLSFCHALHSSLGGSALRVSEQSLRIFRFVLGRNRVVVRQSAIFLLPR